MIWRLLHPPYGITEAGRERSKTMESWILRVAKYRINGFNQLYMRRSADGEIMLLLSEGTDEFHMEGIIEEMRMLRYNLMKNLSLVKSLSMLRAYITGVEYAKTEKDISQCPWKNI